MCRILHPGFLPDGYGCLCLLVLFYLTCANIGKINLILFSLLAKIEIICEKYKNGFYIYHRIAIIPSFLCVIVDYPSSHSLCVRIHQMPCVLRGGWR